MSPATHVAGPSDIEDIGLSDADAHTQTMKDSVACFERENTTIRVITLQTGKTKCTLLISFEVKMLELVPRAAVAFNDGHNLHTTLH